MISNKEILYPLFFKKQTCDAEEDSGMSDNGHNKRKFWNSCEGCYFASETAVRKMMKAMLLH